MPTHNSLITLVGAVLRRTRPNAICIPNRINYILLARLGNLAASVGGISESRLLIEILKETTIFSSLRT